jgi:hypothetical protein
MSTVHASSTAGWYDEITMARSLALGLLAFAIGGCAHAIEQAPPPQDRVVLAVDKPVPETAFEPEPQRGRPRLSQVVTLGQADYAPSPAAPAQPFGGPGVVVNNNITVVTPPPMILGGYGGYYGGYGEGRGSSNNNGVSAGYNGAYGRVGSGEGAQGRPAAPGHSPGVGGNWTPSPSYGPRPLR